MDDERYDFKIVITTRDWPALHQAVRRLVDVKRFVGNLDNAERCVFLQHLMDTGTDWSPDELQRLSAFSRRLRGFSACAIAYFVSDARAAHRPLTIDAMHRCLDERLREQPTALTEIDPLHWSDIGGYQDVKTTLQNEIQRPLLLGETVPSGVLLYGPPGCSKTMFARALATECDLCMFSVTPATVMRSLVGESEAMLREILLQARAAQPAIVFIDEIDTLMPQRAAGGDGRSGVEMKLLSEMLVFLDGAETKDTQRVILVGATNRPDKLDQVIGDR